MRASRLLSILILLQLRGRLTAETLAAEFEVSLRTVYRDIDQLSAAGVPVYADRGPGGGFRLLEGYRTKLTGLTAAEAEALSFAGLPGPAADLGLGEALAAARLKLLAAMPAPLGESAGRMSERFHLDPTDWYHRTSAPPHLAPIAEAVWSGRRVRLRYESWSATVERVVDPLGLVLKAGEWYLVAAVGGARSADGRRTYRIAKVLALEPLEERFERPAGFDLAAHWQKELRRFEASLRRGEAVIRVSAAALSGLRRLGADIAEGVMAASPDAEGWRRATVPIEGIGEAASLFLGFGRDIEVVSPPALRRKLAERAGEVLALYGDDRGPTSLSRALKREKAAAGAQRRRPGEGSSSTGLARPSPSPSLRDGGPPSPAPKRGRGQERRGRGRA
jgi:predicted DNA-binding transcriptional regulator YafY